MEIRGLGIINIRSLFGVEAIRDQKKVELVVELVEWDTKQEYDRLGFEEEKYTVLGVELPMLRIPVTPARNLTTIIEVAARNHLLKVMGYDSALEFEKKLLLRMEEKGTGKLEVEGEVE
jgi:HPr kinase/phosphorylase